LREASFCSAFTRFPAAPVVEGYLEMRHPRLGDLLATEFAVVIVDVVLRCCIWRLHVPVVRLSALSASAIMPTWRLARLQASRTADRRGDYSTQPVSTCWFSVTSISLTMPDTSVETPTLSAST